MALHWSLDPFQHLVMVTAEGEVTRADIEAYLSQVERADAIGWRKLADFRRALTVLTEEDILAIGLIFREADAAGDVGALAVVMPESEPEAERAMRLLSFLAAAKRPMRIFKTIAPAQRWIKSTAFKKGRAT